MKRHPNQGLAYHLAQRGIVCLLSWRMVGHPVRIVDHACSLPTFEGRIVQVVDSYDNLGRPCLSVLCESTYDRRDRQTLQIRFLRWHPGHCAYEQVV